MTKSTSESENPAIPSPQHKTARPRTNRDWWPNQLDLHVLQQHGPRDFVAAWTKVMHLDRFDLPRAGR